MINNKFFEYIFTALLFSIFLYYFYHLDKGVLLERQFSPWDSFYYKQIANSFLKEEFVSIMYPFNERILFPFIIANFVKLFHINIIFSSFVINLISTFIIVIIILFSLNFFKVSKISKFFTIIFFLISFIMPLRYSIYYPGNNYAFDILLFSLIILFTFLQIEKKSKSLFFFCLILSIIATLERGIVIFCMYFFPFIAFIIFKKKITNDSIYKKQIHNFCFYMSASALTLILLKIFGLNGEGDYNMLIEVISSIHFQANIFEFLYKYYYALGIFFLIIITFLLLNLKKFLLKVKSFKTIKIKNLYISIIFLSSIFFSTVGGRGDVDKHLLWFLLPYLTISAIFLDKLFKTPKFNSKILLLIFIIGLLGARPFTPAWPPIGFSNIFVEKNHVNTNYKDELYFGPGFLKKFKNKMSRYTIGEDKIYKNIYVDKNDKFTHEVEIPSGQYFDYAKFRNYIHAYQYRINDIPFPLGYIHNHRNALVDHPYHGHKIIRFIYITQWLILQVLFLIYLSNFKLFKIIR